MLRLVADLFVIINALAGLVVVVLKRVKRQRRLSHAEYQRELEHELQDLDQIQKRIDHKP